MNSAVDLRVALALFSLFGLSYVARRVFRVEIETAPIVAISGVICLAYLGALIGILPLVTDAAVTLGVLAGCVASGYGMLRLARTRGGILLESRTRLLLPLILAVVAIYFWRLWYPHFVTLWWDDFVNWMRTASYVASTGSLWTADSPILLKHYAPGTALFYYYITKIVGYSEPALEWSRVILLLGALLAIVGPIARRNQLAGLCAAFTGSVIFLMFPVNFNNLLVDPLIGMFFAAGVVCAAYEVQPEAAYISAGLIAGTTYLIKTPSILFVVATCTVAVILRYRQFEPAKRLTYAVACLAAPILVAISWKLYVSSITGHEASSLPSFTNLLNAQRTQDILDAALARLMSGPVFTTSGAIHWLLSTAHVVSFVLAGVVTAWLIAKKPDRRTIIITWLILFISLLLYFVGMMATYLLVFSDYEGGRLASFERYISMPLIAMSLILMVMAFVVVWSRHRLVALGLTGIATAGALYAFPVYMVKQLVASPRIEGTLREDVEDFARTAKAVANGHDRIYFIHQETKPVDGMRAYVFQWTVLPNSSQLKCWSIGKPRFKGDIWTCDTDLAEAVKGYDLLALSAADPEFERQYGKLFEGGDVIRGIYRIIEHADGSVNFLNATNSHVTRAK